MKNLHEAITEKNFFNFAAWLLAVTALLVMLTSCSPYDGLTTPAPRATATGTAAPSHTKMVLQTPTPAARTCRVTTGIDAGKLNIRSGAGVGFAVIGLLREGQAATITDEPARAGWAQVTADGMTGYINKTYCRMENKHHGKNYK